MKRKYAVEVQGNRSTWTVHVDAKPEYVEDWRADGLTVHEVHNSVPEWAVSLGLTRIWCFVQDVLNFRNPFA